MRTTSNIGLNNNNNIIMSGHHRASGSGNNNNNNNNASTLPMGHGVLNHNPNMMPRTSYPLRILVHSDAVGAIIGRSGSTIKTITQQTKAKIDVHREESPEHQEKVITINGHPDSCSEACLKIIEVVQNEINAKYDGQADIMNRDITLKILAASNLIGRLIGKSGSTIKKIMEQTATRVNISTNIITESTGEHTVIIVGKLEQVHQAERLISSKLRAAYMSDMNTSLQSMSQQPYLFNNVILPYMPAPYGQNSILASIVNPQTGHANSTISRNMPMATNHQGQMQNPLYTSNASAYLPFYSNMNVPPTGSGLLGFNPMASGNYEQERETIHIHIPSSMVGAIIGKSGSAIKEMISISGASIKVATTQTTAEPESSDQSKEQNNTKANITNNNNNNNSNTNNNNININNNSEIANNIGSEEPSQNCTADSSLTTGSSMSPKVSRHQANTNDAMQRIATRKVTIVGYPASQYSAQYMIYRRISMENGKGDTSLMVEMYIPSQFVGRIIGKGGSTVKQLQKQTRTTIRLPDDKSSNAQLDDPSSGETCVQITGEFEGSIAAQRHIRNMVRDGLVSRQIRLQQQNRNNESSVTKNNAQMNNHQQSDSENETRHRNNDDVDDKTTNEKSTDKFVREIMVNDPMYIGGVSC